MYLVYSNIIINYWDVTCTIVSYFQGIQKPVLPVYIRCFKARVNRAHGRYWVYLGGIGSIRAVLDLSGAKWVRRA